MDQTAVVELEDARISQARLHGDTCAFGTSTGAVLVVDLADGEIVDGYEGHAGEVTALEWDGSELVTGGIDGIVRVFEPQRSRDGSSLYEVVEFDDDDYYYDDDDDDDDELLPLSAAADDDLFDPTAKGDVDAAALARAPLYRALCRDLAPPGDEAIIVSEATPASADEPLEESVELRGHSSRVTGVQSVDGVVYSSSLDQRIIAWDLTTRAARLVASAKSAICCLAVVDNVAIVGLMNGSVAAYDVATGHLVFDIPKAHDGAVRALHVARDALAPDDHGLAGRLVVTGGMDGVVKCYVLTQDADTPDGGLRALPADARKRPPPRTKVERRRRDRVGAHALKGHAGAVVAVQADGTKLVSAATDGSLRVWCLRDGRQLYAITGLSRRISSLHFDRHLLVCDGTDESIVVHDFSDPRAARLGDLGDDDDDDDDPRR
mmetsp:Transcript_351/g.918  ORF Transcript_351/g.918 Transcript_351/m.918 type:complete len:435 (+) Transcript_351:115-1419(+)